MFFRQFRRPILLSFAAVSCLQISGITAIIIYSQPIIDAVISSSGQSDPQTASHLVALISVVRFIATAFSMPVLDKGGRRKCELYSIAGLILCNTLLAFLLSDVATGQQTCHGFNLGMFGKYATLVVIFLHAVAASPGVNIVGWMLPPELFRTNVRPKALFLTSSVYWAGSFLNSIGFDLLQNLLCGWVFLIFAFYQAFIIIYYYFKFPVIDGKSVDEIASSFEENHNLVQTLDRHDQPQKLTLSVKGF